ncbi:MAG: hypothetical protein MHM6MM_002826 [Cercozoa sp. M6MM]
MSERIAFLRLTSDNRLEWVREARNFIPKSPKPRFPLQIQVEGSRGDRQLTILEGGSPILTTAVDKKDFNKKGVLATRGVAVATAAAVAVAVTIVSPVALVAVTTVAIAVILAAVCIVRAAGRASRQAKSQVVVLERARAGGASLPGVALDLLQGGTVIIQRGLLELLTRSKNKRALSALAGFNYLGSNSVKKIKLLRTRLENGASVLEIYCSKTWKESDADTQDYNLKTAIGRAAEKVYTGQDAVTSERLCALTKLSDTIPDMQNIFVDGEIDAYSLDDGKVCVHEVKSRPSAEPAASHLKKYIYPDKSKYVIYKRDEDSFVRQRVFSFSFSSIRRLENRRLVDDFAVKVEVKAAEEDKKCVDSAQFYFNFAYAFIETIREAVEVDKIELIDDKAALTLEELYYKIGRRMETRLMLMLPPCRDYPACRNSACAYYHDSAQLRASEFKTRICSYHKQGRCSYADGCHNAHGDEELRDPLQPLPRDWGVSQYEAPQADRS